MPPRKKSAKKRPRVSLRPRAFTSTPEPLDYVKASADAESTDRKIQHARTAQLVTERMKDFASEVLALYMRSSIQANLSAEDIVASTSVMLDNLAAAESPFFADNDSAHVLARALSGFIVSRVKDLR